MANVFGILTAIVLALSAFVAFKNKDAYEDERRRKRQPQKEHLATSQDRLKDRQEVLDALPVEIAPAWMPKSPS